MENFFQSVYKELHLIYFSIFLLSTIFVFIKFRDEIKFIFLVLISIILNEIFFELGISQFSFEKKFLYDLFGLETYLNSKINLTSKINLLFILVGLFFSKSENLKKIFFWLNQFQFFFYSLLCFIHFLNIRIFFGEYFLVFVKVELIANLCFCILIYFKQKKTESFGLQIADSIIPSLVLNNDFEIKEFNNAFENQFKIKKNFLEFFGESTKTNLLSQIKNLNTNKNESFSLELEITKDENDSLNVITIFSFFKSKNFFLVQLINIEKYKLMEKIFHREKEKYEKEILQKSTYFANMNHELRTPLNSIINFSNFIIDEAKEKNESQILSDAENIKESGYELLDLISRIVELEKIKNEKFSLISSKFNLNDLVLEIISKLKTGYAQNRNSFEFNFQTNLVEIITDKEKLKLIIYQFLDNAFKFTLNGKIYFEINSLRISEIIFLNFLIEDTGVGISETKLKDLANPFSDLNELKTKQFKGLGQGFTLAKNYIEILGGKIEYESKEGVGTKINFLIPLEKELDEPKLLEK